MCISHEFLKTYKDKKMSGFDYIQAIIHDPRYKGMHIKNKDTFIYIFQDDSLIQTVLTLSSILYEAHSNTWCMYHRWDDCYNDGNCVFSKNLKIEKEEEEDVVTIKE